MTKRPLVIVGVSGFGRETADVIEATGRPIAGFLDDSPSEANLILLARRGGVFLGGVGEWLTHAPPHDYLIGIGHGGVRQRVAEALDQAGHTATRAIHPSVTIGHDVRTGPGAVLCAGARLTTNVTLGRHVHLNLNASVGHDATLGDYVSVNPAACISGMVSIETRTLLGAASTVLQNLTIGADVVVGASALVTRDVPAGVTVKGIPGRW